MTRRDGRPLVVDFVTSGFRFRPVMVRRFLFRNRTSRRSVVGRFVVGLCAVLLCVGASRAVAQELECSVNVDYSQLTGSDFGFLDDLERRAQEYMNDQTWTEDRFREVERIRCSMQIILLEAVSLTEFRARIIVAAKRPIYGTAQSTPVVRLNDDDWRFEYSRGTPLVFNLEQYNPLTSLLDFYAYIILGYDYDTFSPLGGTPYFQQARRIADRAEAAGGSGWSSLGSDQGRVELITELLDQRHQPLRRASFEYHLNGLDRFVTETDAARSTIYDVLVDLQKLDEAVSRSYALSVFFSAKYTELTAVFLNSRSSDRAYDILTQVDPSHSSEYNQLVN